MRARAHSNALARRPAGERIPMRSPAAVDTTLSARVLSVDGFRCTLGVCKMGCPGFALGRSHWRYKL
eukprot:906878-Prymnesium_polylepis.1